MYIFFIHESEGGDPAWVGLRPAKDRLNSLCLEENSIVPKLLDWFRRDRNGDGGVYKKNIRCIFFGAETHPPGSFSRFRLRRDGVRRAFGADAVFFQQILEIGSLQARGL